MTFFSLTGLVIAITNLSMVIVLMSYKNKTLMHITWMMFCISAFIWGTGGIFIGANTNPSQGLILWKLTHIGIIMIPAFFVHFTFEFARSKGGLIITLNYIIALVFQFLNNYSKIFINRTRFVFDEFYYDSPATPVYSAFVIWFIACIIFSHLYLYIKAVSFEKIQQQQAHIFIAAMILSFSGGITSFFPVYGVDIYPYGNILASIYPLVITYAIVKYRFLDMRFTTVKVTKYLFLLIISSLTATSLAVLKIIPYNVVGFAFASAIGTGVFLYIQSWPYWEKIFWVSSITDLKEKAQKVMQSKVTFNSIQELEQFLNSIFQENNFAKQVKILKKENIWEYQNVFEFFANNQGDIYVGDEQIEINQRLEKTKLIYEKEVQHKLFFPILIEQNKIRWLIMFEQADEDQLYNANQIQILKTVIPKISLIYEAIQFNEKLQQEIQEKTKDLEERTEELFVSNDKLRKIDEEKDVFIGMAAHEMRTPMTIMRGYADMLRTEQCGPLTEEQKVMVQKIIDGNESLMTLINDILDLSKIESGKTQFTFEEVNINSILQEIYVSFQWLMSEKKIQFSLIKEIDNSSPFITDKSKFILIVTNLLSNAYKYTPENGQVAFKIKTEFKKSLPHLVLSVKDSGIWIPKDEIPKLFDRFANISTHSKIKTKIQSTGLGLSIVKRIITEMEWDIVVESDTDKGADFIVNLPYKPEKAEKEIS